MTQLLRPIADISAGGWTASSGSSLFATVDEVTASGADYMRSPDNPTTQAVTLKYGPGVGTHSSCTTRAQLQARGGTTEFVLELLQGATVLDTWSELVTVADGLVTKTHVSTGISITDATDLRPRVTAREPQTVRRLALHCTMPGFTPSEATPFDLDACTINDGDDITELLKDIGAQWGNVYVRAPSRDLSVIAQTTQWNEDIPGTPIKTFVFLEDQSASNTLTITHYVPDVNDTFTLPYEGTSYKGATLWTFEDHEYVKIGGSNLAMTFVGTHPGLGTGDYITTPYTSPTPQYHESQGFIEARMVDGSSPDLLDIRANIRFTHRYAIYTYNGQAVDPSTGDTAYRIKDVNVSGTMYATSGVFLHQGVKDTWSDPDNFKVTDPYCRNSGWDGTAPGTTQGGLLLGCNIQTRDQVRFSGFAGYNMDTMTGGVTLEYGTGNWIQRLTGRIGNSASDPYVVKVKDWNVSGPGTAYPAGVRVKKTVEMILMKGDPNDREGGSGPVRFVKFQKLTDTYGSGPGTDFLSGCASSNEYFDGPSNLIRLENSLPSRYNRDWHVIIDGDWNTNFIRGDLFLFGYQEEGADARSYGNTLEATSGTTIPDLITMYDTNTVKGAGTFTNIRVSDFNTVMVGQNNLITATNVAGVITIDAGTGTTTISSVVFTGSARAVITVGAGSAAVVTSITAPSGSTITGAGTLNYNGSGVSMPFAIP